MLSSTLQKNWRSQLTPPVLILFILFFREWLHTGWEYPCRLSIRERYSWKACMQSGKRFCPL